MNHHSTAPGFTLIELIVAIMISVIFLGSILTIASTTNKLSITSTQYEIANQQAYANLREYANGALATWYTCPGTSPHTQTAFTSTAAVTKLAPPIQQQVVATAPYGCTSNIVKVTSTITYGPENKKVTHAIYTTR